MKHLNIIKLVMGCLLLIMSIILSVPFFYHLDGRYTVTQRSDIYSYDDATYTTHGIVDSYYPIAVGCMAIAGAICLASIKKEK